MAEIAEFFDEPINAVKGAMQKKIGFPTRKDIARSAWQPIETAPVDSDVLLFVPDDFVGVGMGWEMARSNKEIYWTVHGIGEVDPTHWMPLPEPPK